VSHSPYLNESLPGCLKNNGAQYLYNS
jgi:hypothetical protein